MFRVAVIDNDIEIGNLIKNKVNETGIVFCSDVFEGPISYLNSEKEHDILLLDVLMPEMNGVDAIPLLLKKNPDLLIIMNTIKSDAEVIFKALKAGAIGYLDKQTINIDYATVFTAILSGGGFMTPAVSRQVITHFQGNIIEKEKLTDREFEVAQGIMDGMSYNLVSADLGIIINTVRMHIRNIYKKLQVNSKVELINQLNKS